MAGVPFEAIENIATLRDSSRRLENSSMPKRNFRVQRPRLNRSLRPAGAISRKTNFAPGAKRFGPASCHRPRCPVKRLCASAGRARSWLATAESVLTELLAGDLATARKSLFAATHKYLPPYLVFAAAGVCERIANQTASISLSHRNKKARADERHLVPLPAADCGKNDSLSEFGPGSWGTVDARTEGMNFDPQPGIAQREIFLERWTAHGAAAAINADPETRPEIAPHLHPAGRLEQDHFVLTETGQTIPLDPETIALLERCDGTRPAHSLGAELEKLHTLAGQKLIQWEMEVPALDAHAFDHLLDDISKWRDQPVRTRWLRPTSTNRRSVEKIRPHFRPAFSSRHH